MTNHARFACIVMHILDANTECLQLACCGPPACSIMTAAIAKRAVCGALHTCNRRHGYPICVGQVGVVLHECALHACTINLSDEAVHAGLQPYSIVSHTLRQGHAGRVKRFLHSTEKGSEAEVECRDEVAWLPVPITSCL